MRCLAVSALLLACAHSPPRAATVAPVATEPLVAPLLAGRLREVREALSPSGVVFQGVAAAGFIAHGAHVTTPFEVPAGRCLSVHSLASSGVHDLDAQLYDPDGDMLVEDVETDSHPTVQICASEPRRVFHMISAYEGQGAYAVASFVTDRANLDAIARVVGGRPATAGVSGPARGELERRVSELRDGIARRGFQPTGDPARLTLRAGARVRAAFPVSADRCFTFGAFSDGGLSAVQLSVVDAGGSVIARDRRGERDALAQVCPRFSTTYSVEASGVRGEGVVVLHAWSADAAAVGGGGALWLGERFDWQGSAGSLAETSAIGRQRLALQGFRATRGAPDPLSLSSGDLVERPFVTSGSGCTAVLAAAGRGAGRVSLSIHGTDGAVLARGEQGEGGALVAVCGASSAGRTLRVGLEAGSGEVLIEQFDGPALGWMEGLDPSLVSEAWSALWLHPAPRWSLRGSPVRARVGGGARPLQSLERAAGRCVRSALVVGAARPTVELIARDPAGASITRSVGEGRAGLERCGEAAESIRAELGVLSAGAPVSEGLWMVWDEHDEAAPGAR